MMAEIIVAVVCNLIALLILISGVFTAKSNGFRVTLIKFIGTLGALVGSYFLTSLVSNKLYEINNFEIFISDIIGASVGTINSCLFFMIFMVFYAFILMICSIVKHSLIKRMQEKKLNRLKIKRAKSINPKAERMVRKSEWKLAKSKYAERRRWYHKLLSCLLGSIIALSIGIVTLMPFGYIGRDINKASDKEYLIKGFEYTLNRVIPDSFFDYIIHNREEVEIEGCSHEYVDGVCNKCGESEIPAESPCDHTYEEGICTQCGEAEIIG